MGLSEKQMAAVRHKDGPALIIAGPGSGKTTVITERTRYLIEEHQVPASQILVITFTKAAAEEMKERFCRLCPQYGVLVRFGTFHSVFFMMLKRAYGYRAEHIVRDEKKYEILKEILNGMSLEINDEQELLSAVASEISMVKGDQIALEHYHAVCCGDDEFRLFYRNYEDFLLRAGMLDFDDMLVYCYELLKERKDIRAMWQKQYPYILVDEFQDINRIQYDTVRLLAGERANLFIVGDDDQSIYRFRGAKPEIMLNFQRDYPNAVSVLLEKNYRCTNHIVKAAGYLIQHNRRRFQKHLQAVHSSPQPVMLRMFRDVEAESRYIITQMREHHKNGVPFSEMAVLFRTNIQPRPLVLKLMEQNIPFVMRDFMPNLFEHWITKNIIAYLVLAQCMQQGQPMMREQFLQIMNRPLRYLSRSALGEIIDFHDLMQYYKEKPWMEERIVKLFRDFRILAGMRPYAAIAYIRKGIDYEGYLKVYASERKLDAEELFGVLDEIEESAKPFETLDAWFAFMEQYAQELKEQQARRWQEAEGVCLSTMHSAKGLEYHTVFIMDANEGIVPHRKAVLDADIEEERRLFYVAMTRARQDLYICAVKERYHKKIEKSRFLGELINDGKQNTLGKSLRKNGG